MLAGIAWLVNVYQIGATDPGAPGYQSILSMLVAAISGGIFYYVSHRLHAAGAGAIGQHCVCGFSAAVPGHRVWMAICPDLLRLRGRRLVYSRGNCMFSAALAAALLIIFGGVTDRLIPLFAVGAFLAFTLSQAGMVFHWRRRGGPGAVHSMLVNGLGAFATGHDGAGGAGGEICRGRLDHRAADSRLLLAMVMSAGIMSACGQCSRQSVTAGA